MKIKNAIEAREYIIEELKRTFVGPGKGHFIKDIASFQFDPKNIDRHKQEILEQSPKQTYLSGLLYPQKLNDDNFEQNNEDEEDENAQDNINDENSTIEKNFSELDASQLEINENDVENDNQIDNNRDIDLTNEYKQSAIGLSVLIKVPETLVIRINDMGLYRNLKKDIPQEILIICLFLSKFAKDKKSYDWFKNNFLIKNNQRGKIHLFLFHIFNIRVNRIKNIEDYYDKYFKFRKGWKNRINSEYDRIFLKYGSQDFEYLSQIVKKILNTQIKNNENNKDQEEDAVGYAREKINSSIIIQKRELLSKKRFIEKIFEKQNGEKIPLKLSITIRESKKSEDIKYLTLAIVNINEYDEKIPLNKIFFQSNFSIEDENNKPIFLGFDDINKKDLDPEEQSIYLLHHLRENYAIGHGCSVNWLMNSNNECIKVFSEVIPVSEVRPITAVKIPNINLSMKNFSENIDFAIDELSKLINLYSEWLSNEKKYGEKLDDSIFKNASKKNLENCYLILNRINEGLEILKKDKVIQKAFKLMNQAMYMQQVHYIIDPKQFEKNINYDQILNELEKGQWRAFQICFILLNIKSISDPNCSDREIVDLIWFPTGGGKTEAYLGLSALVIFLRKLKKKNSIGSAILMRYTLRLLTTQQFQRASSLICACEKIRRTNEEEFGKNIISIGLWVGSNVTPNDLKDAEFNLSELLEPTEEKDATKNKFIILKCPWCNTKMKPEDYQIYKKEFKFVCGNTVCDFSNINNSLPIKVIDTEIYKNPPTLLIGTIDKFATLPWREEAINSYDSARDKNYEPPDLIIQDELHLISGPLGSVAGMYEIIIKAISESSSKDNSSKKAKIIGSTATISRANLQIKNLYGRTCNIFPPQANKLEDSFFAKEIKDPKILGRKYVGLFAPSASSMEVTLSQIMSTLVLAGGYLKEKSGENLDVYDPYWTNLIYFNSIRELMKGSSLIDGDASELTRNKWLKKGILPSFFGGKIVKYVGNYLVSKKYSINEIVTQNNQNYICVQDHEAGTKAVIENMYWEKYIKNIDDIKEKKNNKKLIFENESLKKSYENLRRIFSNDTSELTSRIDSSLIPKELEILELNANEDESLSACLATNMIQVGIDIGRLSLMTIVGQPKTTSEYIQASSRVGREKEKPGLVITQLSHTKLRDRSHYEKFSSYHQNLYKFVEPTSVTAHSDPVRKRCLPAIVIFLIRFWSKKHRKLPNIPDDKIIEKVKKFICEFVENAEPDHKEEINKTRQEIDYIISRWKSDTPEDYGSIGTKIVKTKKSVLMRPSGSEKKLEGNSFETPTSMRNVDKECAASLIQSD